LKVLVGMRGDLADRLVEIPKVLGYRLRPNQIFSVGEFEPAQAAIVLKVIAQTERLAVDERFVEELAQTELASREDGRISPVDLQILAWMLDRQAVGEMRAFNQQAFQQLGGVDGLLTRFLERTLATEPSKAGRDAALKALLSLTDLERNVRAGTLAVDEIWVKEPDLAAAELEDAVEWLARSDVRLVTRVERDAREEYELAHERLIPALLRLVGKELTATDKANQLLNRRVNEWLGNNRSSRYLLSWRELRLVDQHRAYLRWGENRGGKESLIKRSRGQVRWQMGMVGVPLVLVLIFSAWSYTPSGQIQWVCWWVMDINRYVRLDNNFIQAALNLDMVAGVRNNPFPQFWLDWFAFERYRHNYLSKIIKVAAESQDVKLAEQLLSQVTDVTTAMGEDKDAAINKSRLLSEVAQVYTNKLRLYRINYAELQSRRQQMRHLRRKFSKFLKPYPERLISFNLLLMPSTAPLVVR
jgi:hypothetical protein